MVVVKEQRQKMGMTQEAFANQLGVSVMTIRRWESGASKPSRMAQKLLADVAELVDTATPRKLKSDKRVGKIEAQLGSRVVGFSKEKQVGK